MVGIFYCILLFSITLPQTPMNLPKSNEITNTRGCFFYFRNNSGFTTEEAKIAEFSKENRNKTHNLFWEANYADSAFTRRVMLCFFVTDILISYGFIAGKGQILYHFSSRKM